MFESSVREGKPESRNSLCGNCNKRNGSGDYGSWELLNRCTTVCFTLKRVSSFK